VIAISGSGNSENVIKAVEYANLNSAFTLSLTGFDGGKLKLISKNNFWVIVDDMQLAEDIHSIFGHIVMQRLCIQINEGNKMADIFELLVSSGISHWFLLKQTNINLTIQHLIKCYNKKLHLLLELTLNEIIIFKIR
jgi:hypothetical protein